MPVFRAGAVLTAQSLAATSPPDASVHQSLLHIDRRPDKAFMRPAHRRDLRGHTLVGRWRPRLGSGLRLQAQESAVDRKVGACHERCLVGRQVDD
jgi:hypothetical protein